MEKSSFFNAVLDSSGNPDRVYLAEDFAQFFSTFIGNGVFPNPSSQLQVVAIDNNMTIRIKAGFAWINGYMYQNTSDYIFDLDPADGVLDRIDRVVLRLDFLERKIRRAVKKGDYSSNAVPKTLQRDADAYEIALADVYVNKGIISIIQANITDLRLSKELCGIVHGTVDQADTTAIFNQFQSWYSTTKTNYDKDMTAWTEEKKQDFDTWYTTNTAAFMEQFNSWYNTNTTQWENDFNIWFSTIKNQLDGDVAAKLSADVVALKEGKVDKVTGKGLSTNDYSNAEKQEVAKISNIESNLGEMENKKVNYTDLTPVNTTGTSSAYIATIPNGMTEVTIIPHVNNLANATLNGTVILDREGKPIETSTLKYNIPTKLVRVGNSFFLASGGAIIKAQGILDKYGRELVRKPIFAPPRTTGKRYMPLYGVNKDTEIFNIKDSSSNTKDYIKIKKNGCLVVADMLSLTNSPSNFSPLMYCESNGYFYSIYCYIDTFYGVTINSNSPYDIKFLGQIEGIVGMTSQGPRTFLMDGNKIYIVGTSSNKIRIARYSVNMDGTITKELENVGITTFRLMDALKDLRFGTDGNSIIVETVNTSYKFLNLSIIDKDSLTLTKQIEVQNQLLMVIQQNVRQSMFSKDDIHYYKRNDNSSSVIEKRAISDNSLVASIDLLNLGFHKSNDIFDIENMRTIINYYHSGCMFGETDNFELLFLGYYMNLTTGLHEFGIQKISPDFTKVESYAMLDTDATITGSPELSALHIECGNLIIGFTAYDSSKALCPIIVSTNI